jgi:hypothetical protein
MVWTSSPFAPLRVDDPRTNAVVSSADHDPLGMARGTGQTLYGLRGAGREWVLECVDKHRQPERGKQLADFYRTLERSERLNGNGRANGQHCAVSQPR